MSMRQCRLAILTVGLPRSGKSTWCREQIRKLGAAIINPDSFRLALTQQNFLKSAEGFVWAGAELAFKAAFYAGHQTVILDATNLTVKRRRKWTETVDQLNQEMGLVNSIATSPQYITVMYKVFTTPMELCIERAIQSGRQDLVKVIREMETYKEPLGPDDQEYMDDRRGLPGDQGWSGD